MYQEIDKHCSESSMNEHVHSSFTTVSCQILTQKLEKRIKKNQSKSINYNSSDFSQNQNTLFYRSSLQIKKQEFQQQQQQNHTEWKKSFERINSNHDKINESTPNHKIFLQNPFKQTYSYHQSKN